jgi:hypothetical protein
VTRTAFVLAAVAVLACAPERDAHLLSVGAVGPDWVEPGAELRIEGQGFPVGRDARVELDGRMHRPGAPADAVSVAVAGRAVSGERIVVRGTAALLEAVGGRGTFEGHVRVVFAGAPGLGSLSGVSAPLTLDMADPVRALSAEVERSHRARRWLDTVGLGLEEVPSERGLTVAEVGPTGEAARAGLRAGDILRRADGVRLRSLGDVAPAPAAGKARLLEVERPGTHATFEVPLFPPAVADALPPELPWLAGGLLLLLAWVGPTGRALGAVPRFIATLLSRGAKVPVLRLRPFLRKAVALRLLVAAALAGPTAMLAWSFLRVPPWAAPLLVPGLGLAASSLVLAGLARGLWLRARGREPARTLEVRLLP